MPTALITGVTGQDGSYLAEHLLGKGYRVVGVVRRTSHDSYERIDHLLGRLTIVAADLLDQHSLTTVVRDVLPDEVYNLAAQSFVPTSWNQPVLTGEFTALGSPACWRRCTWHIPRRESTRPAPRKCSARWPILPRMKRRRSILARPTGWRRSMATTSP